MIGTIEWIFDTLRLLTWMDWFAAYFPAWLALYAIGWRIDRAKAKRAGTEPIYETGRDLDTIFIWTWFPFAIIVENWPL